MLVKESAHLLTVVSEPFKLSCFGCSLFATQTTDLDPIASTLNQPVITDTTEAFAMAEPAGAAQDVAPRAGIEVDTQVRIIWNPRSYLSL